MGVTSVNSVTDGAVAHDCADRSSRALDFIEKEYLLCPLICYEVVSRPLGNCCTELRCVCVTGCLK